MSKIALITGATGQDGAYLSQLLLEKGYTVYGSYRRSSNDTMWRLRELNVDKDVKLVSLEMMEFSNILRVVDRIKPDEVYNLAAQSFVQSSFEQPIQTSDTNGLGVVRLLEALRVVNPKVRFYQASTSEMYGKIQSPVQNEETQFYPRSPYGVSKLYAHWMTINYREAHNMHTSCGILFNHESPLRGHEFVTRKITMELARIAHGDSRPLELGNLNAKRDWGYAKEYVEGMWRMLQQPHGEEYVLATGSHITVREFVEKAAFAADMPIEWVGKDLGECGIHKKTGQTIVTINPEFYRPSEVDVLLGDSTKAQKILGWQTRVGIDELAGYMMNADLKRVK